MYRKILKPDGFQADKATYRKNILIIGFCCIGWIRAACGETSAVADTMEPDTVATAAGVTENLVPNGAAANVDTGKQPVRSAVGGATDSDAPAGRTPGVTARRTGHRKFVHAALVFRTMTGRVFSSLRRRVATVNLHSKKIFFLAGSIILIFITIQFYQNYREQGRFMTTTRLSIMDKEVQRACQYIEQHYEEPALDLEGICRALVTGGAFLEALFMKELGLSVEDFILQVRINRAKIALRKNPGLAVESLARSVGFDDQELFLMRFEAVTGTGCRAYGEALAKGGNAAA